MIEINLLPEDLKRHARSRGGGGRRTIVLCLVLVVVAGGGAGYFHVVHLGARQRRRDLLAARLATLQRDTQELATLEAAIKHIAKRKRTLTALYAERILWAEKFDQLVDITPKNVWFRSIKLAAPRRRRLGSTSGGTFSMECYSAGADEKGITLFRERLEAHEGFWKDVARKNRIRHRKREFPAYVEGVALDFTVELQLKSRKPAPPKAPRRRTRTASTGR